MVMTIHQIKSQDCSCNFLFLAGWAAPFFPRWATALYVHNRSYVSVSHSHGHGWIDTVIDVCTYYAHMDSYIEVLYSRCVETKFKILLHPCSLDWLTYYILKEEKNWNESRFVTHRSEKRKKPNCDIEKRVKKIPGGMHFFRWRRSGRYSLEEPGQHHSSREKKMMMQW